MGVSKSNKPAKPPETSSIIVPVAAERVVVRKHRRTTGRVRVRTRTSTEAVPVRAALFDEAVEIARVAVDRIVETPPDIRTEGEVTIIPVIEEVVVVERKLRLKEEIHVRRTVKSRTVEDVVTIRTQRVEIERGKPPSES